MAAPHVTFDHATFDPGALAAACRQASDSLPDLAGLTPADLAPLRPKGTSNDHIRLGAGGTHGGAYVARVPRFSHGGLDPATNLARQQAAFARAAASGHTPRLHAVLPIGAGLPAGALIVDHIDGRAPRLPADMAAIAEALAALHALPVSAAAAAAPLAFATDPVAATRAAIDAHAGCLADAGLAPAARAALDAELAWARGFDPATLPELPPRFVASDTHPGNFLIDGAGKAWFTDLEKAQYGAVPIDLAHASLPTSTGWDPDVAGTLADADIAAFHAAWRRRADPALAAACAPWWRPLRRLTWLRTMTFLARWRADWSRNPAAGRRDAAMDRHIAEHIAACFEPAAIAAARRQWLGPDALVLTG
jgi:hypothetical protein